MLLGNSSSDMKCGPASFLSCYLGTVVQAWTEAVPFQDSYATLTPCSLCPHTWYSYWFYVCVLFCFFEEEVKKKCSVQGRQSFCLLERLERNNAKCKSVQSLVYYKIKASIGFLMGTSLHSETNLQNLWFLTLVNVISVIAILNPSPLPTLQKDRNFNLVTAQQESPFCSSQTETCMLNFKNAFALAPALDMC